MDLKGAKHRKVVVKWIRVEEQRRSEGAKEQIRVPALIEWVSLRKER
jgi:hypothetical protein